MSAAAVVSGANGGGPVWINRGRGDLTPRWAHAMAYDSALPATVLFGGYDTNVPSDSTWEWDGDRWREIPKSGPWPAARTFHPIVYDASRREIMLFGGHLVPGVELNDTWVWNGSTWSEKCRSCDPPIRHLHAMAYDNTRARVVLFGGAHIGYPLGDTWEWDGSRWEQKSPAMSPSARTQHAMADGPNGRVVLFGGTDTSGFRADTWEWNANGNAWQRMAENGPSPRAGHRMAYDSDRQVMVLFGGQDPAGRRLADTWEWNGKIWFKTGDGGPPARSHHAMAYDSDRRRTLLFGGADAANNPVTPDTWEYGFTCHKFAWKMGSVGSGPGQFAADLSPRGMVVVGDLLYVCDYGNNRIQWFEKCSGKYRGEVALGRYVTDIDYNAELKRFYVRTPNHVVAYDSNWNVACEVNIPTEAWVHYGLCIDSHGNIHTPSSYYSTVYIVSPDCGVIGQYPGCWQQATGVAIEASCGFIYLGAGDYGICKYTEDGRFVDRVLGGDEGPAFLARLPNCRMAVCLAKPQQVAIFDGGWQEECRFGGVGSGDGQFMGQQGIAADGSEELFVTDAALHRVQRFAPDRKRGDLNCDGKINNFDIDAFVLALTVPSRYAVVYPCCDWMLADMNADGYVDNFDIDPFVRCLTRGECP